MRIACAILLLAGCGGSTPSRLQHLATAIDVDHVDVLVGIGVSNPLFVPGHIDGIDYKMPRPVCGAAGGESAIGGQSAGAAGAAASDRGRTDRATPSIHE